MQQWASKRPIWFLFACEAKPHALTFEKQGEVIILGRKISITKIVIYKVLFTKEGKLETQETLHRYLQVWLQVSLKQSTLDNWLGEDKEFSKNQETRNNKAEVQEGAQVKGAGLRTETNNAAASEFKKENRLYIEGFLDDWDDTICNTELDMRHDKNGNVIGWMEGEPKEDEWDGSVDNRIRNLEDHVSKRGWLF